MGTLITAEFWAGGDNRWHASGRPAGFPVDPVPDPTTFRLTRLWASGVPSTPPPPPPPPGTRLVDAGALLPGLQTYPIPTTGTVRYVDCTNGNDTTGDGTVGNPWKTANKAATTIGSNTTVVLRGYSATTNPTCTGLYREGATPGGAPGGAANGIYWQAIGTTVMAYPGEAVWFEGSRVQTGWVAHTSTVWKKTSWGQFGAGAGIPAFDRSPTAQRGAGDSNTSEGGSWIYIDPNFPIAMWGEQVFVDDVPLKQVATLAEVVPGTFFLEGTLKGGTGADKNLFAGSVCYIGTNPTGKVVRASDLSVAMILNAAAGTTANITLKGFGIRRYMPALYDNAVLKMQAAGSTVENIYVQHISSTGITASLRPNLTIRRTTVERCGFRGIHSHQSDNLMIESVRITGADHRRFNPAPECGGFKITACNTVTVKNSVISNNFCHGLWTDASVGNIKFLTNNIQSNVNGHGVMIELSDTAVVADNLVTNNGKIGLYMQSSDHCRLWNNTVIQSNMAGSRAVDCFDDERTYGVLTYGYDNRSTAWQPSTTWWVVTTYHQYNNVIGVQGTGSVTYLFSTRSTSADGYRTTIQMGVRSDGNLFLRSGTVPANPFSLARAGGNTDYNSLATYRAAYPALDPRSVFVQGGAPLDADFSLTSAAETAYSAVPVPTGLPADIAAMIGKPAGTVHLGAFI